MVQVQTSLHLPSIGVYSKDSSLISWCEWNSLGVVTAPRRQSEAGHLPIESIYPSAIPGLPCSIVGTYIQLHLNRAKQCEAKGHYVHSQHKQSLNLIAIHIHAENFIILIKYTCITFHVHEIQTLWRVERNEAESV